MVKIIIICLIPINTFCQLKQTLKFTDDAIIDKWTHAVVNIECFQSHGKILDSVWNQFLLGRVHNYNHIIDSINAIGNVQYGTAVLLEYKKDTFLLSARHVLLDTSANDTSHICWKIVLLENPSTDLNNIQGLSISSHGNLVETQNAEITQLTSIYDSSYFFTSKNDDVGIINLNAVGSGILFLKTIKKRGYIPIKISDVESNFQLAKNDSVVSVGFPEETVVGEHPPSFFNLWLGNFITLPMITKGNLENWNGSQNFFELNIFTYHGFSGGPIIDINNKLIGIVSGADFPVLQTKSIKLNAFAFYHSRFIKSKVIINALKTFDRNIYK